MKKQMRNLLRYANDGISSSQLHEQTTNQIKNMTATRSTSEITAELKTARAAFGHYNKVQFEGYGNPDNYYLNPHHVAIEALSAELRTIEQAAVTDKLSGDSLKAEQAWFNSQQFRFPDVAQKACNARGYNLQDLFDAAKKAKQAA